ncbi:MAG: hypothetical protein MMC33_008250 [Icmadophila ericetorum]|nr:hypothetical protein [Icmadophila ericetorum]
MLRKFEPPKPPSTTAAEIEHDRLVEAILVPALKAQAIDEGKYVSGVFGSAETSSAVLMRRRLLSQYELCVWFGETYDF